MSIKKQYVPSFTGYFRDGTKRIDLVLVINDDGDGKVEMLRVNFLTNVVKTGLEIELEQGVRAKNKNLIFVKIHAPSHVIIDYGEFFNIRRFFKDNHADFINPTSWYMNMLPTGKKQERELVKFVRKNNEGPLNYSNLERSTIVYKILLMLPFGLYENYVGLDRLMAHGIILDVFPLHDGPYFFVPNQDPTKINGRQVLTRTWLNIGKLVTCRQPYSLIHDYMGERVAFYYAFLDYYIKALFLASILSIICFLIAYNLKDEHDVISSLCRGATGVLVCGACATHAWCPSRDFSEYCDKTKLVHVTHSIPIACLCFLIGLGSTLLIPLWERRTCYLNWLWEIDQSNTRKAVRPEYIIPDNLPWRNNYIRQIFLTFYNILVYAIYVAIILAIMLAVMYFKHAIFYMTLGTKTYRNFYYVLAMIAVCNFVFAAVMQYVNFKLCYALTDVENHRTYAAHGSSYVWKLFIFNVLCYSFLILFSAYFVVFGHWYRSPIGTPTLLDDIKYMNCGPFGCGDEMSLILVVILVMKEIVAKLPWQVLPIQSEYKVVKTGNARVPVWEREYELCKINENSLDKMYLNLMLQMVLGLFFLQACPLSPLLLLISNLWDICYRSHHMVKGCRRPLVRNSSGIGAWQQVIVAVGYAIALFNILCVSLSTELVERELYHVIKTTNFSRQFQYYQSIYDYYIFFVSSKNGACYYPIMYDKGLGVNRYWQPKRYKWWGILVCLHATIVFAVIVRWLITRCPKDIKETIRTEKYITYRYYLAKGVTK